MRLRVLSAALVLAVALGCSAPGEGPQHRRDGADDSPGSAATPEHPAVGGPGGIGEPGDPGHARSSVHRFWVNPDSGAAWQVREWEQAGRYPEANLIRRISEQPVAEWLDDDPTVARDHASYVARAATEDGRQALLVAYNIPHRDCGRYSTGGAPDGDSYRRWIDAVAEGIGDRAATVILEPDAVPHLVDGCAPPEHHQERYDLLYYALQHLTERPRTTVYLDAGNATWIRNVPALAQALQRAGISMADGFSLNVANFETTEANREFGYQLSRALGGAHFVIDTSRNGRGALDGHDGGQNPGEGWCNPPGRGLGRPPTTETGDPLVDAYLWVKYPGDSDGECRGGPPAGQWWPDYALDLARNALR